MYFVSKYILMYFCPSLAATLFTAETPEVFCGLATLHPPPPPSLHWHSGEWLMREFNFFGELHLDLTSWYRPQVSVFCCDCYVLIIQLIVYY